MEKTSHLYFISEKNGKFSNEQFYTVFENVLQEVFPNEINLLEKDELFQHLLIIFYQNAEMYSKSTSSIKTPYSNFGENYYLQYQPPIWQPQLMTSNFYNLQSQYQFMQQPQFTNQTSSQFYNLANDHKKHQKKAKSEKTGKSEKKQKKSKKEITKQKVTSKQTHRIQIDDKFNDSSLTDQLKQIEAKIKSAKSDQKEFYTNVKNLILFLLKISGISESSKYIEIVSADSPEANLLPDATDLLFETGAFSQSDFVNLVKKFENHITFYVLYQPEYKMKFDEIISLKQRQFPQLKLGILISGIEAIDSHFRDNLEINCVKISDVKTVSSFAFYGCKSLSIVSLSSSVTLIDKYAFANCSSLLSIVIPSSVTRIAQSAFKYCESLKKIFVESPQIEIERSAFSDCGALVEVVLENGLDQINDLLFTNCSSLPEIRLPPSIRRIGNSAFNNCTALKEISLPEHLASIDSYAFSGVKDLSITGSIKVLLAKAFSTNKTLERISFSEPLETIKFSCFSNCSVLQEVVFPSSLKIIEENAFESCGNIRKLKFPRSLTSIGISAFRNCFKLTEILFDENSELTSLGSSAFSGCSSLDNVAIPYSLKVIKNSTFFGCKSLKNLQYPSIIAISNSAFQQCPVQSIISSNLLKDDDDKLFQDNE